MTATPIPRTLALTYFGDMDVSVLDEKPAGRKPIATRLVSTERMDEVVAAIGRAIAAGDRVYWICPLVAESEVVDLAAAEDRYAELQRDLRRGGRARARQARRARQGRAPWSASRAGETKILVVDHRVEVGVDVPEATVMVVEHAERFGLAQLHQLRGRIGRGERASTCLLLYKGPLGADREGAPRDDARDRGRLPHRRGGPAAARRGRGARHAPIRPARLPPRPPRARRRASHGGPRRRPPDRSSATRELASERGQALRVLLYLFERDAAVRLLGRVDHAASGVAQRHPGSRHRLRSVPALRSLRPGRSWRRFGATVGARAASACEGRRRLRFAPGWMTPADMTSLAASSTLIVSSRLHARGR